MDESTELETVHLVLCASSTLSRDIPVLNKHIFSLFLLKKESFTVEDVFPEIQEEIYQSSC